MAQTALTIQSISETALEATYANADTENGNKVINPGGDLILHFKNPGASAAVVTVTAQKTSKNVPGLGPLTKASITCNLAAGEDCFVGPLNTEFWNLGGSVFMTFSGVGSGDVDIAALRPTKP